MRNLQKHKILLVSGVFFALGASVDARADSVMEWNIKAREIVVDAKLRTAHSNRALAIVHTSVYEAVNAITKKYPASLPLKAADNSSIDAAIASAVRVSLLYLMPDRSRELEEVYAEALAKIEDGDEKAQGIAIGQQAANTVWAARKNDGSQYPETYRPYTTAGNYVPTTIPAVPSWANRKPWMFSDPTRFRPGPPPKLASDVWVRDFNAVKRMGSRNSEDRSEEQTRMAKFWEATLPPIYHGVVHSVANMPGRDVTQNARLFAAVTRATDDAMIAVFEAKYHYGFWRPITAIRNADIDGNEGTLTDPAWVPFIPTPMHPEYPCAHCVVAGTVGAILKAEIGENATPELWTVSYTDGGARRSWTSVDDFIQEVSDARIYDGVHYRTSTEVGSAMGLEIGALAVETYLSPLKSAGNPEDN
ncbi:vanadium-dependent haloperoxidase [Erythrobacter ani]|uniref:Vanadium-dependent haloperoxidase n=1 Tax=Erythrobacter ani TaxID=2827235 RepID=A0ABS6SI67_9SPHN|nr:vanadium-dependent haloperoxidase [Erythrobacter ani]MBV7264561.1 vanadium-dependent haloperoxidase [Erythrobacter ani]